MDCSVDGCPGRYHAKGYCGKHYHYVCRYGVPEPKPKTPVADRFWPKVMVTPGCWLWRGAQDPYGYGRFERDGSARLSHRIAYELLVGPIPDGLTLDHLCRNPSCVNPKHLEPVTNAENVRRAAAVNVAPHCPHGHEFTPENTYRRKNGHRLCRQCARDSAIRKNNLTRKRETAASRRLAAAS